MKQVVPPMIRVFISSTFADMNQERDYFNKVISPKLRRLCSEHGVSFFSVDLRWGITEEDQVNDMVLPICLKEVDNCRPYFIGIIGNRYGSILSKVKESSKECFPWLDKLLDRSVTELEMYYGVLMHENEGEMPNCAFFFRSDELSNQFFAELESEEKQLKLSKLKQTIRQNPGIPSYDYNSLKEFEDGLTAAITSWLNKVFPTTESVHNARKNWYNNELLRNYIRVDELHRFLDEYCSNTQHSLIIYGDGKRGKTTALTSWQPKNCKKILINCGSEDGYNYWPAIANEIIGELRKLDRNIGFPKFEANASFSFRLEEILQSEGELKHTMYFVTDHDLESFRRGFITWLKEIRLNEKVYIIINDVNLVTDAGASYMSWLPSETNNSIRIICSTNDSSIVENARMLGWNQKELPLFSKEDTVCFLDSYMSIYGKKMTESQKYHLLDSPLLRYLGYQKFIIQYLNNYANFENLDMLTEVFGKITSEQDLYKYVLTSMMERLSILETKATKIALAILSLSSYALCEETLLELTHNFVNIDPIGWARIRVIFEQFQIISTDNWKIRDQNLVDVVLGFDVDFDAIHSALGSYYRSHMDEHISYTSEGIARNTAYAKAALRHNCAAKNWEKLIDLLSDSFILYYLTKIEFHIVRSSWVHLLIETDLDIPKKLMSVFEKYQDKDHWIKGIAQRLTSLMYELELFSYSVDAAKMAGTVAFSPNSVLDTDMPKKLVKSYEYFCKLKSEYSFEKLLPEIRSFLEKYSSKLGAKGLCAFYALKGEGELRCHDYKSGFQTAYLFYKAAISSMDNYEILKANRMRGDLLYFDGSYKEAKETLLLCQKLAMDHGYVREYLSSLDMLGMCFYRLDDFTKSKENLQLGIRTWKKLGNQIDYFATRINLCNAFYMSGDLPSAIKESEALCAEIEQFHGKKFLIQRIRLGTNLAIYYSEYFNDEKAENAFLSVLDLAETTDFLPMTAYNKLIIFYKNHRRFTKAITIYQRWIEKLYQHNQYYVLAEKVMECVDLMAVNQYRHEADVLKKKWERFFNSIPGGQKMFESVMQLNDDPMVEERLNEELIIAQSENNMKKCGDLLLELSSLNTKYAVVHKYDLCCKAMESYYSCKDYENAEKAACYALCTLILADPRDDRINDLSKRFAVEDQYIIKNWQNLEVGELTDEQCTEVVDDILARSEKGHYLTAYCLLHELHTLIVHLNKEKLLFLLTWMSVSSLYEEFTYLISVIAEENFETDLTYLKSNYVSTYADDLLIFYDKIITLYEVFKPEKAGVWAGNLALIYRRREDEEKTFQSHNTSIRVFRKLNMHEDELIENLNLATSYRNFGKEEKAIELLRQALHDPEINNHQYLRASIAGNLAALLRNQMVNGNNHIDIEEIMQCFDIEESYFEASGESRELAISLINQVSFYVFVKNHQSIAEDKFKKAECIISKYHLSEFYLALKKIRPDIFKENVSNRQNSNTSIFTLFKRKPHKKAKLINLINKLISNKDVSYSVERIEKENDKELNVLCLPKYDYYVVNVNLQLSLAVESSYRIDYLFVMQPTIVIHDKMRVIMKQYVDWWNEKDIYELQIIEIDDNELIMLKGTIESRKWKVVKKEYDKISALWHVDAMIMSLAAIGKADLDVLQAEKSRLLKGL